VELKAGERADIEQMAMLIDGDCGNFGIRASLVCVDNFNESERVSKHPVGYF
jgi:hypothetical protein